MRAGFLLLMMISVWSGKSSAAHGAEACAPVDADTVASWFDGWNLALATRSPGQVVKRYWPDAVMLPTTLNTPRTTPAMIRDYFERFLEKQPRARIDTRTIQISCNLAMDVGTYTFSMMDSKGRIDEFVADFTYVYQHRNGAWRILHHRSSGMPEIAVSAEPRARIAHEVSQPPRANQKSKGSPVVAALQAIPGITLAQVTEQNPGGSRPFLNVDASPSVEQFYPAQARERREAGSVALQICAAADGTTTGRPEILRESGSSDLDAAATAWARAAKWIPATYNNKAVGGCTQVQVLFKAPT